MRGLLLYAGLWIAFGAIHSALATSQIKAAISRFVGSYERLIYNVIAVATFIGLISVGHVLIQGSFSIPEWIYALMVATSILGAAIVVGGMRSYDLDRFAGFAQLRPAGDQNDPDDVEPLALAGLNGFVRHPIYSGAILFFWGMASTHAGFATAIFATAYILIGLRFEERKLLRIYGKPYAAYRATVPALLPRMFAGKFVPK